VETVYGFIQLKFISTSALSWQSVAINYSLHTINKNESHDNMEASELHKLQEQLCGALKVVAMIAARLHDVLLFIV
jgi:hypothetical protein